MNRKIDALNRITIPKEILQKLNISSGDELEIIVNDNDEIVLAQASRNKSTTEIYEMVKKIEDQARTQYNVGVLDALNWVLNIKEGLE